MGALSTSLLRGAEGIVHLLLSGSNHIEGVLSARRQYTSAPREKLFLPTRTTGGILLVWNS